MRKLRQAAVVVAMVGSVGMIGAGTAFADGYGSDMGYGHHKAEGKGDHKQEKEHKGWDKKGHDESKKGHEAKEAAVELPDFIVNNPQFMDCSYVDNTNTALTQVGTAVTGDATNTATLGNVCVQTGPTFTEGDDA